MIDVAKLPRIFVYSISIIVTLALPPFRAACAGTTFGATVKHLGLGQMLRRRSGPHWVRAEDPENSDTLTLSSLVMSSSLIAVVRPEGTFATINHGILRTDYKVVRLERIISNTFANVRDLSVNSHIIIADQLMADGAEFADDMVPGRGERVLVFLRRLLRLQNRDQKAFTLYQYVAAYVSKYEISPDNRLTPMSVRTTVLSNQMAGQRLDDIVSTALFQSRTGFRAIIVPIGFNDITRGYAQYKTALATNPWAVEQQFAIRDAQRAGVVFHAH